MVGKQDGAQLGELGRRVFQGGEQEGAIVEAERDQLDAFGDGALEPVGQVVSAAAADECGELEFDGVVGDGWGRRASSGRHSRRAPLVWQ